MNYYYCNTVKAESFSIRKMIIGILFLVLSTSVVKSQENVVHTDEYISIRTGTNLYLMGSYDSRNTVSLPIINQGVFNLQGNLIHNGTSNMFGLTPTEGKLRFFGNPATDASITSGTALHFHHLDIDLATNLSAGGNVLLRNSNTKAWGNIQFLSGGFDIDTNIFNIQYDGVTNLGITTEGAEARPYQITMSPAGRISVLNYPFASGSNYTNIMGTGISFSQSDPLGGTPILSRTFDSLACGFTYNSILRGFNIQGNTNPAQFSNASIGFINPSELGDNPNGTNLRIFVSEDKGQVWRPKNVDPSSTASSTVSVGGARFMPPLNYTVITAATPCTSILPLEVDQIITSVSPNDTLFNINEALVCDPLNVSARVMGHTDPGSYIEWRADTSNIYVPQEPAGYFDANTFGFYWVRSTSIRGCIDSMQIEVISTTPADTDFTPAPTSLCIGTAVNLIPDDLEELTSTYQWTFGDGDTSNAYSTSHTYLAIGTYNVTLQVTTNLGCVYSQTESVNVKAIPVADFIAGAACPGSSVNFDNNSYVNGYTGLVDLDWNFGDSSIGSTTGNSSGSSGTGDTSHIYATEGTFPVTLTASANGCTSPPTVINITVYPVPVADFTVTNACAGLNASFNNITTISDASAMTYLWDFTGGGGPTSNTANPSFAYATPGTYNVNLTATSTNGCTNLITQAVTIYQNPVAAFNFSNVCVNNLAGFADVTPVIAGSTPYTYAWTFGDGNTGNIANESNVYTAPGTYSVTMTVTTSNSCVGSTTQNITIFPGPTVSFTALNSCVNTAINFINTSTNSVSYSWNFPSIAQTATTQNTNQTFTNDGTFPVYLTATSSNGCQATDTGSITIYPRPTVNLGTTVTTCGSSYVLDANPANINAGSTFLWNTGATTPQFTATYNSNFSVTVTSGFGCTASSSANVTLNGNVTPNLGPNSTFCDSTTIDAGYPGSTYLWSTGAITQTLNVTSTGTYSVTVTDQNSCVGSGSVVITIVPGTPVNLGADQNVCADLPVTLNAGAATSYLWSDGSTSSTLLVPSDGYYWVQNTNGGGCTSRDTVFVSYIPIPSVNLGADQTVCDQTILSAFIPNGSYLWNTSEITSSINVTTSNTYIVTVTNTLTTCDNSDTVDVIVNPLPTVSLGNDFSICSYATGTVDAGNPGATYAWNSGQTTQVITVATTGNYVVTVTDGNGCVNTDNITVVQLPLFTINLGPDRQFCDGSTIILDAGLTTLGNSYLWEDELGATIGTGATYQVADTGMHYLTVTDADNCVATDSVNITPSNISLNAFYLADSDIINGESVVFVNLSYPRPYTSQWYLQNVLVSTDSMPTITFNLPVTPPSDTVYVKLKVDNTFCQSEITKPIVINSAFAPPPSGEATPVDNSLFSAIRNSILYPNPNNGIFNLMVDLYSEAPIEINIFSLTGGLIQTQKQTVSTTVLSFDVKGLSTGVYLLQIKVNNESKVHKFVVLPY